MVPQGSWPFELVARMTMYCTPCGAIFNVRLFKKVAPHGP